MDRKDPAPVPDVADQGFAQGFVLEALLNVGVVVEADGVEGLDCLRLKVGEVVGKDDLKEARFFAHHLEHRFADFDGLVAKAVGF